MTKLLEEAFAAASQLPEEEQNAIARAILEELDAEHRWNKIFEESADTLEKLAEEALQEHRAGRTKTLDPGQL